MAVRAHHVKLVVLADKPINDENVFGATRMHLYVLAYDLGCGHGTPLFPVMAE